MREDFADGILVATHHTGETADPDTYRDSVDESTLLDLTEKLGAFIPGLETARLRGDYCGIYSDTPDHDFIIDQPGPAGLVLGCGFSGHGFKHGPAVGRLLSDLVLDRTTADLDVDLDFFSLSRFDEDPTGHGLAEDAV
jgi:glycine/D-amino acid oxidase-like deaminating enzyme